MNFMMKSLLVFTALMMVGCNTDDAITCPDAITGDLTAVETKFTGSWVLSGLEAKDLVDITDDNTDNPSKDIFAQYTPCQRDLVYEFLNTRGYVFKQGTISTDCQNTKNNTGTWSFQNNILIFVSGCATQRIDIELNEEQDKFKYSAIVNIRDVNGLIKSTTVTFSFQKIQA